MYLLDTDTCIRVLRREDVVLERFSKEGTASIFLSAVTELELLYGARHSKAVARHLRKVEVFTGPLTIFPFDSATAEEASKIKQDLAARGCPIGPYDAMIAAHAIQHRLAIVTGNVREFGRIDGLRIETW